MAGKERINPYDTPELRKIATSGTILRCVVGSVMHGISTGTGDRDEWGICIEPREYVIGLRQFHQYQHRTQPVGVRSGPGDLDLTIYSARKWMNLALAGNPNILLLLFAPKASVVHLTETGKSLRGGGEFLVSQVAGHRALGYLNTHRDRLLRNDGRPDLIKQYGYDTKLAGHLVRIAFQGGELMATGMNELPMPEPYRTYIKEIRTGLWDVKEVFEVTEHLEHEMIHSLGTSDLPKNPDRRAADHWLSTAYEYVWAGMDEEIT